MTDPQREAERTAAIASQMCDPFCKRRMTAISESWARMRRNDAAPMPYYPRGD